MRQLDPTQLQPGVPASASFAASAQALPEAALPGPLRDLGFELRRSALATVLEPPTVSVPAGPFVMGSDPSKDPSAYSDECPQRLITTEDFQIGKFPVTVAEYSIAVQEGIVPEPGVFRGVTWQDQMRKPALPVTSVSWYHAVAYTVWLSECLGRPCRLPTEAEWEKAARGDDGRIYPWGDNWDPERANTPDRGVGQLAEIGLYPEGVSPFGVEDMAGNVWEWCSTILKPYAYKRDDGREDLYVLGDRIMRGGAWYCVPYNSRAACRGYGYSGMYLGGGFRLIVGSSWQQLVA